MAKLFQKLFQKLTDRQQDVLIRRFGIGREEETLEAIGSDIGVTRERVRQIQALALNVVGDEVNSDKEAQQILKEGMKILRGSGGVMKRELMLQELADLRSAITEGHLALLLAASRSFYAHSGDTNFFPLYYLDAQSLRRAKSFLDAWVKALEAEKERVLEGAFDEVFMKFTKKKSVSPSHANHFIYVSRRIHESPFGERGLADWPEINPRTIRDRIYITLKKHAKPVHFEDVARLINETGFEKKKKAIPSTVHNELIKDSRFVLVGRGMYGLSEHGHKPGTAKDVIKRVLKAQGALSSAEVIDAVQNERLFKPNTILVNLQDRQAFRRREDGRYEVKEA